ncbi:MAG: hypothetical protein H7257_02665 [Taibaiella sp.]|nr:hypothetical protein [Taibaiella sp.]
MDGLIKMKVSELSASLVERIKALFQGSEDTEITITFEHQSPSCQDKLFRSKSDMEASKNLVTFTMEELEAYSSGGTA